MSNATHLISGFDGATATFALTVFFGGAALTVFAILIIYMVRRAGLTGMVGVLGGAGLVLVGAMLAAVLLDRQVVRDHAAERRAIELRSAELTARAVTPGSALACLDGIASVVVETACEKALFATPEAVASAVAYVDARLSLLAVSKSLADRDKSYQSTFDRMRRPLEEDRFGLVAHVLATRGCSPTECADLEVLHDTDHVVANMKAKAFESQVGVHALAWQPGGAGATNLASAVSQPASPAAPLPGLATGLPPLPPAPTTAGGGGKFDYPSAASIPPVSIMNAEPGSPPSAEAKPAAAPAPKRGTPRRQAAKPVTPAAPPPPPLNTSPPAQTEAPQTSGQR